MDDYFSKFGAFDDSGLYCAIKALLVPHHKRRVKQATMGDGHKYNRQAEMHARMLEQDTTISVPALACKNGLSEGYVGTLITVALDADVLQNLTSPAQPQRAEKVLHCLDECFQFVQGCVPERECELQDGACCCAACRVGKPPSVKEPVPPVAAPHQKKLHRMSRHRPRDGCNIRVAIHRLHGIHSPFQKQNTLYPPGIIATPF
eukprot:7353467-Pyramimonas_sp.AAC.1